MTVTYGNVCATSSDRPPTTTCHPQLRQMKTCGPACIIHACAIVHTSTAAQCLSTGPGNRPRYWEWRLALASVHLSTPSLVDPASRLALPHDCRWPWVNAFCDTAHAPMHAEATIRGSNGATFACWCLHVLCDLKCSPCHLLHDGLMACAIATSACAIAHALLPRHVVHPYERNVNHVVDYNGVW